ncbi:MAG: hypothetical protein D6731_08345 [Planctomycetota bacterium]|nr:MAG: hypothetical protein D6731_08345 [Planctomycetota bacterium]
MLRACARTLGAVLGICAGFAPPAAAEVFVFRDGGRESRGRVLAEFEDMLYVRLDGEGERFVARSALSAVLSDDRARRYTDPVPGAFAPLKRFAPAAALSAVVGGVGVGAAETPATAASNPPVFLRPGEEVGTAADGFARLVLPGGGELRLAPLTRVVVGEVQGAEGFSLLRGEVHLRTALKPVALRLPAPLRGRAEPGAVAELSRERGSVRARVYEGRVLLGTEEARLEVEDGQGAALVRDGSAWRVRADPANDGPLVLRARQARFEIPPGGVHPLGVVASGVVGEQRTWRLLVSRGSLSVRRGREGDFERLPEGRGRAEGFVAGDALQTGGGASATLVRSDGATLTLGERTRLELAEVLELSAGRLTVEAVEEVLRLRTPGGVAALSLVAAAFVRESAAQSVGVRVVAGHLELPLGPAATLQLDRGGQARVEASAELGPVSVLLEVGEGRVVSRARAGEDPGFGVTLRSGERLAVRAPREGPVVLELPGERELAFAGAGVGAEIELEPEVRVRCATGAAFGMREGLALTLGSVSGRPEIRFRDGTTRLLLEHPYSLLIENPSVLLRLEGGGSVRIRLEGVAARLEEGGPYAVAALGLRESDRLEISGRGEVRLDRQRDLHRFVYADARQLWIQDGAPPVESRFGDARGTAFLSMPGAPALGTEPGRPLVVLATREGEFVILDRSALGEGQAELEGLAGEGRGAPVPVLTEDPFPNLLDVPPPASPSGP